MKRDLDALMEKRGLDAMVIGGKTLGNPPLVYVLDGARVTQALFVKRRGAPPALIVSPMEREEARASGHRVILNTRYDYGALLQTHAGNALHAAVAYHRRILEDLGIAGRVGFYGHSDQGQAYSLLQALEAATPNVEIVGEYDDNLLQEARATKDAAEVERIRDVGRRTIEVVRQTVAFLQQHTVDESGVLRRGEAHGPLTVGHAHDHIRRLLALQGLEAPEGFIFATGRDAGIPHSQGRREAPLRLGESIVFDIFPREVGGGYFFDLTRTFCLGYAPEAVARLHRTVMDCLTRIKDAIQAGEPTRRYQQMACACFEAAGHPVVGTDPKTLNGYVHGLGHGVGLDVHEAPGFHDNPANTTRLAPGHVFTLEPGLYYPEEGMGCRLEDVLWIDQAGAVHNLTNYSYDLVVPMPHAG